MEEERSFKDLMVKNTETKWDVANLPNLSLPQKQVFRVKNSLRKTLILHHSICASFSRFC